MEEGAGEWTAGPTGEGPAAAIQAPSLVQERVRTSQQRHQGMTHKPGAVPLALVGQLKGHMEGFDIS